MTNKERFGPWAVSGRLMVERGHRSLRTKRRGWGASWTSLASNSIFCCFPDRIERVWSDGKYLMVDTATKRYRVYERAGRKPRRRLIGFIGELQ